MGKQKCKRWKENQLQYLVWSGCQAFVIRFIEILSPTFHEKTLWNIFTETYVLLNIIWIVFFKCNSLTKDYVELCKKNKGKLLYRSLQDETADNCLILAEYLLRIFIQNIPGFVSSDHCLFLYYLFLYFLFWITPWGGSRWFMDTFILFIISNADTKQLISY